MVQNKHSSLGFMFRKPSQRVASLMRNNIEAALMQNRKIR